MTIALEGTPVHYADGGNAGNFVMPAFTTTQATRLFLVFYTFNSFGSSISGGGLTWSRRAITGGNNDIEMWTALAPTALTGMVATVTLTGGTSGASADLFAFSGVDSSTVWDPNGGLPVVNGFGPGPATISTTNAKDVIISAFTYFSGSGTVDAAFTQISSANQLLTQYKIVSTAQTNLSISGGSGANAYLADAAIAAVIGPTPDSAATVIDHTHIVGTFDAAGFACTVGTGSTSTISLQATLGFISPVLTITNGTTTTESWTLTAASGGILPGVTIGLGFPAGAIVNINGGSASVNTFTPTNATTAEDITANTTFTVTGPHDATLTYNATVPTTTIVSRYSVGTNPLYTPTLNFASGTLTNGQVCRLDMIANSDDATVMAGASFVFNYSGTSDGVGVVYMGHGLPMMGDLNRRPGHLKAARDAKNG